PGHHPASAGARRPPRRPLRLHAGLERVPVRAGLHQRRQAADVAGRSLHVHHGRCLRLGLPHGRRRPYHTPGDRRLHLPPAVHGGRAHGREREWMTCPACQQDNPDGARFCNGCGTRLTAATLAATPQAYTPPHLADKILTARDADPSVRAVVLRGAGDRAFASGTDIRQFLDFKTREDALDYEARLTRVLSKLAGMSNPTIAMLQGDAIGGGLFIALACDLRLAAPHARF